jgi:hypothetical protein
MTRFLANWEVESDIILPQQIPFVRHEQDKRDDQNTTSAGRQFDIPRAA